METFKEEMEDYVDENGTSLVPQLRLSVYATRKESAAVRSNGIKGKMTRRRERRGQNLKGGRGTV